MDKTQAPQSPPPLGLSVQALLASNSLQAETARVEGEYEHLQEEYRTLKTELEVRFARHRAGSSFQATQRSLFGIRHPLCRHQRPSSELAPTPHSQQWAKKVGKNWDFEIPRMPFFLIVGSL